MSSPLPLEDKLKVGAQTIHRRTEPATGPWLPSMAEGKALVEMIDRLGYDSIWCGDHLSFAIPILEVMRMRFGDVVGYTFLVAVVCFAASAVAMALIPPRL